jgi:hypothetical protein
MDIKKTDDLNEMLRIAHEICEEKKQIYTPMTLGKMFREVEDRMPNSTPEEKETMVYRAIYDWWAFGANVAEEFYYHFYEKTVAEKEEYMVNNNRGVYVAHLNPGDETKMMKQLENKYALYQRLKPYYKREIIQISGESDFDLFEGFIKRHDTFVVKPVDWYFGIGVHKVSMDMYGNDSRTAFDSILSEGADIQKNHTRRNSAMVLEELIEQDESLAVLHPGSVNGIRATAVKGKDGKIHIYHPWIKVGMNGIFVASAALNGFDAEIDPATGVIISDGYQENGNVYKTHPNTGITVKGFQIPKWDELVHFVDEIMAELPEYGYVGWDLVLTPDGWCVMEGNYSGEFMFQLINGRGYKREFEELIGWKFDKEYWWQA